MSVRTEKWDIVEGGYLENLCVPLRLGGVGVLVHDSVRMYSPWAQQLVLFTHALWSVWKSSGLSVLLRYDINNIPISAPATQTEYLYRKTVASLRL
jgi:hypothetical protein